VPATVLPVSLADCPPGCRRVARPLRNLERRPPLVAPVISSHSSPRSSVTMSPTRSSGGKTSTTPSAGLGDPLLGRAGTVPVMLEVMLVGSDVGLRERLADVARLRYQGGL